MFFTFIGMMKRQIITKKFILFLFLLLIFLFLLSQISTFNKIRMTPNNSINKNQENPSFINKESNISKTKKFSYHGVNPSSMDKYQDAVYKKMFKCPDENQILNIEKLNDNYCDCEKTGFDEPGTNACFRSKFYCQKEKYVFGEISSSHVNDGICDCCDGTDEWMDIRLPIHLTLSKYVQNQLNKFQTPCPKQC